MLAQNLFWGRCSGPFFCTKKTRLSLKAVLKKNRSGIRGNWALINSKWSLQPWIWSLSVKKSNWAKVNGLVLPGSSKIIAHEWIFWLTWLKWTIWKVGDWWKRRRLILDDWIRWWDCIIDKNGNFSLKWCRSDRRGNFIGQDAYHCRACGHTCASVKCFCASVCHLRITVMGWCVSACVCVRERERERKQERREEEREREREREIVFNIFSHVNTFSILSLSYLENETLGNWNCCGQVNCAQY